MSAIPTYRVFITVELEDLSGFLVTREKCIGIFDGDDGDENEADAEVLFDWVVKNS